MLHCNVRNLLNHGVVRWSIIIAISFYECIYQHSGQTFAHVRAMEQLKARLCEAELLILSFSCPVSPSFTHRLSSVSGVTHRMINKKNRNILRRRLVA